MDSDYDACQVDTNCNWQDSSTPVIRSCSKTNSYGTCDGTLQETCSNGVWTESSGCNANVPEAEACDGEDNDCDGSTDEGCQWCCDDDDGDEYVGSHSYAFGMRCDNSTEGTQWLETACTSVTTCGDFATSPQVHNDPPACLTEDPANLGNNACDANSGVNRGVTESCNGVDDDCDESTDETWPTLGDACTNGVGACQASGNVVCNVAGDGTTCDAVPGTPGTEVCDTTDHDCDGGVHTASSVALTQPTVCGVGACASTGTETCSAGVWGSDTCTPGAPTAEVCGDGIDNDCDGATDGADTDLCCADSDCGSDEKCFNNICDAIPTLDGCTVSAATIATGIGADALTASCTVSDLDGFADIDRIQILVNWYDVAPDTAPAPFCNSNTDPDCGGYFTWDRSAGTFTENHNADGYYGTDKTTLDAASSSASCSGNSCTADFVFSYTSEWIRTDNDISMNARDENAPKTSAGRVGWGIPAGNYDLFSAVQCIVDSDCADPTNNWCNGNSCAARITCYEDADSDGFGNGTVSQLFGATACTAVSGWVADDTDCDDNPAACGSSCFPAVSPNDEGTGDCDGYDNDCDTLIDENTGSLNCHGSPQCSGLIDCSNYAWSACPTNIGCTLEL
ncbi:hypothetical protein GF367_04770, partial [Candidatus Woesearchaeota archaeon]|nr:hypothetical protein [Candidatus Woesearchaeota archaeon]